MAVPEPPFGGGSAELGEAPLELLRLGRVALGLLPLGVHDLRRRARGEAVVAELRPRPVTLADRGPQLLFERPPRGLVSCLTATAGTVPSGLLATSTPRTRVSSPANRKSSGTSTTTPSPPAAIRRASDTISIDRRARASRPLSRWAGSGSGIGESTSSSRSPGR